MNNGNYETYVFVEIGTKRYETAKKNFSIKPNETETSETSGTSRTRSGSSCLTYWECTEWSACVDGFQERTCVKEDLLCVSPEAKPEEGRICENNANNQNSNETNINQNTEENQGLFGRITGAVIGENGKPESFVYVFVILGMIMIMAIIFNLAVVRRNKRKKILSNGLR